jgi:hypothetical protein
MFSQIVVEDTERYKDHGDHYALQNIYSLC